MNRKKPTQFTSTTSFPDPFNMVRQPYQPKPRKNYRPIVIRFVVILLLLFVAAYATDFLGVQQKVNSVQPVFATLMNQLKAWAPAAPDNAKPAGVSGNGFVTPHSVEATTSPSMLGLQATQISLLNAGLPTLQNPLIPTDKPVVGGLLPEQTPTPPTLTETSSSAQPSSSATEPPPADSNLIALAGIQPVLLGSSELTPIVIDDSGLIIPQGNNEPIPTADSAPKNIAPDASAPALNAAVETPIPSADPAVTDQDQSSITTPSEVAEVSVSNIEVSSVPATDVQAQPAVDAQVPAVNQPATTIGNLVAAPVIVTAPPLSGETSAAVPPTQPVASAPVTEGPLTSGSPAIVEGSVAGTTESTVIAPVTVTNITYAPAIALPRTVQDPNIIGVWVIPLYPTPAPVSTGSTENSASTPIDAASSPATNSPEKDAAATTSTGSVMPSAVVPVSEVGVIVSTEPNATVTSTGTTTSVTTPVSPSESITSIAQGSQQPAGPSAPLIPTSTSSEVGVIMVVEEVPGTLAENPATVSSAPAPTSGVPVTTSSVPQQNTSSAPASSSTSNTTSVDAAFSSANTVENTTESAPAASQTGTSQPTVQSAGSATGGSSLPVAKPLSNRASEQPAPVAANQSIPLNQIVLQTPIPIFGQPTPTQGAIVIPTDGPTPTATPYVPPTATPIGATPAPVQPTTAPQATVVIQPPAGATQPATGNTDGGAAIQPTNIPLVTLAPGQPTPTSTLVITVTTLPKSGFADEVGLPLLTLGTLILIGALILIRMLRLKSLE
ncbi:MAG TPA: hypothetical protein PKD55_02040 [Bellilinea sp.]|nr:hypothetical protein [Bellilinea sp.]